jgi:hypothetical protein
MTQTIAVDVPLGPARTGAAIGCIVYQLDGSTVYSTFDVAGWYEAPAGSGKWHHPGVVGPDAGGMIAVGVLGTEYDRQAFPAVPATVTGFATPADVSDAQTAITDAIGLLNDLSVADIMNFAVETGVNLQAVLRIILAVIAGNYEANDANNPTEISFYAPDGTTLRVTFTLTDTTRDRA